MTFALGYITGVLCTLAFLAWWAGATRKTPDERAADDAAQLDALRASGETGIA